MGRGSNWVSGSWSFKMSAGLVFQNRAWGSRWCLGVEVGFWGQVLGWVVGLGVRVGFRDKGRGYLSSGYGTWDGVRLRSRGWVLESGFGSQYISKPDTDTDQDHETCLENRPRTHVPKPNPVQCPKNPTSTPVPKPNPNSESKPRPPVPKLIPNPYLKT